MAAPDNCPVAPPRRASFRDYIRELFALYCAITAGVVATVWLSHLNHDVLEQNKATMKRIEAAMQQYCHEHRGWVESQKEPTK